jgi:hypothetical protein
MSSGGRDLGCRARAALFAALAGGPSLGPAWAAQDADQAPAAPSHHIVSADHRIDPIFPDLHGGVWQVLHGRVPPDEARWHPTSYRPDAEAFDVTSAGAPRAAPIAPPAPPVPVAPPPVVAPPVAAPPVIPAAPAAAPPAVASPAPVAAAVAATPPSVKRVVARVADAPGSLPYGLRPRPPIEEAVVAPAVAAPPAPTALAGGLGHCLVHSSDVAVMRARLKACVTAALALSTSAGHAAKR